MKKLILLIAALLVLAIPAKAVTYQYTWADTNTSEIVTNIAKSLATNAVLQNMLWGTNTAEGTITNRGVNGVKIQGSLTATNNTAFIGLLNFPADLGGPFIDISVTAATAGGTKIGYTNRVDGLDLMRVFANSVGDGTITNASVDIRGVSGGIAASAGFVGEVISSLVASGAATSLTTATAKNVTSISLTAGDWDVSGNINFIAATATTTSTSGGITTTSATVPTDGTEVFSGVQVTLLSGNDSITIPRKQINVLTTTTVYLVGSCTFSAGAVTAFGSISARRIR